MQPYNPKNINWQPLTQIQGGSGISIPRKGYQPMQWKPIAPPRQWAAVTLDWPTYDNIGAPVELNSRTLKYNSSYDKVLVGPPEGEQYEVQNFQAQKMVVVGKFDAPLNDASLYAKVNRSLSKGFSVINSLQGFCTIGPIALRHTGPSERNNYRLNLQMVNVNLISSPFEFADFRDSVTGIFGFTSNDNGIRYSRENVPSGEFIESGNRTTALRYASDGIYENGANILRRIYGLSFEPLMLANDIFSVADHYEYEIETELIDLRLFAAEQP